MKAIVSNAVELKTVYFEFGKICSEKDGVRIDLDDGNTIRIRRGDKDSTSIMVGWIVEKGSLNLLPKIEIEKPRNRTRQGKLNIITDRGNLGLDVCYNGSPIDLGNKEEVIE